MAEVTRRAFARFRGNRRQLEKRVRALEKELEQVRAAGGAESNADAQAREILRTNNRWREQILEIVRGMSPYMAVDIRGALFFFDTADAKTGRKLFVKGGLPPDQDVLRRAVRSLDDAGKPVTRDVFIDVGAHIGTTTVFALRHLHFREAVAIEPSLANMMLLRLNVVANGLEGAVRYVHGAVSNETSTAALEPGVSSMLHSLVTRRVVRRAAAADSDDHPRRARRRRSLRSGSCGCPLDGHRGP